MKISVLTPTYNRAYILGNLYNSLLINSKTNDNFEWLIMDDGSTDDTCKLVDSWIKEDKIDIKYYYKQNGGKMSALNDLVQYVSGDIIIEVDSDDYLADNSLEIIRKDYESLDNSKNIYGIVYSKNLKGLNLKIDESLKDKVLTLYDIHFKYGLDFDMTITFYADIRKKFKYELENNEKFITEASMYHKMDKLYDGLLIKTDEIIICEYRQDGYTNNIINMFKKYPYGYYKYFLELINYKSDKVLLKKRIYMIKHYILFNYLTNKKMSECISKVSGVNKLYVIFLVIPGYIYSSIKFKKTS